MSSLRIKVTKNEFAKIAAGLGPKLEKVVATAALAVESAAKREAPYKTGNLRRSIGSQFANALHAQVGTDVEYARYVEYGTTHMAARPYLTPAVELQRVRFLAAVRDTLKMAT